MTTLLPQRKADPARYFTRSDCGTLGTVEIAPLPRAASDRINYASRNSFIRRRKLPKPTPATKCPYGAHERAEILIPVGYQAAVCQRLQPGRVVRVSALADAG